jgi:hypothetical protein
VTRCGAPVSSSPRGGLGRHEALHLREREREAAQLLEPPAPRRPGRGRGIGQRLFMDTAAVGVAEEEEEEQGLHAPDLCDRVVLCLAALPCRLGSRVLGADATPGRPVMGTRGAARAPAPTGAGAAAHGVTTVAASAAEPRRQGGQRARRGGAAGAPCRQQHREEDRHPLIGCALAHAEDASLAHWKRAGLARSPQKPPPILRGRQGAVGAHGTLAGRPRLPIEAPWGPRRLKRRLTGRDQRRQLVEGQAGAIPERRGARREIGQPYMGHRGCLLAWEAQYTINRDNLKWKHRS